MTGPVERLEGFAPVWAEDARALVLGSMPGLESLRRSRYYAHPRNAFWEVVGAAVGADPLAPYDARLAALVRGGIALWDVAHRCDRRGSLDTAIREVEANDIAGLVARLPHLRAILCNGQKAHELLQRHVLRPDPGALRAVEVIRLPSTSPANASVPPAARRQSWHDALARAGIDIETV